MKIAINTRFLLKDKLEGIGWVTYEIVRRLVENNPADEFIFLFDRPYDPRFIFAKNVKPLVLNPPARHPFLWYWWFEFSVAKALKKQHVDIFLSMDSYCSINVDTPTVMYLHDLAYLHFPEQIPNLVRKYYEHFVPKFIKRADHIITISKFVKNDILKHYNKPTNKIDVIYNACREEFKPLSENEKETVRKKYSNGKNYFFYVGAVHPRKNVARLMMAFDLFKKKTNSPIQLLIAGRFAWQTGDVKMTYDEIESKSDIQFLGYVSDEKMTKLMGAAFALTYVSLFEGFGLPLLEAMQSNVPVITSNVSSMPEVAGDAALLVDPKSINEISNAMTLLATSKVKRKSLIENGRKQSLLFNWNLSAQQLYEILINLHRSLKKDQ